MTNDFCGPCQIRKKVSEAVRYCKTCREALCKDCADVHKSCKATRDHFLVGIRDITVISEKGGTIENLQYCAYHQEKVLEFFCIRHNHLLCSTCILHDQERNCNNVIEIKEAGKTLRSKFTEKVTNDLHAVKFQLENNLVWISKLMSYVENEFMDIQNWLENMKVQLVTRFEKVQNDILSKIKAEKFSETKHLQNLEHKVKENLEEIIDSILVSESVIQNGSESDIFRCILLVGHCLEKCQTEFPETTSSFVEIRNHPLELSKALQLMLSESMPMVECFESSNRFAVSTFPQMHSSFNEFIELLLSSDKNKTQKNNLPEQGNENSKEEDNLPKHSTCSDFYDGIQLSKRDISTFHDTKSMAYENQVFDQSSTTLTLPPTNYFYIGQQVFFLKFPTNVQNAIQKAETESQPCSSLPFQTTYNLQAGRPIFAGASNVPVPLQTSYHFTAGRPLSVAAPNVSVPLQTTRHLQTNRPLSAGASKESVDRETAVDTRPSTNQIEKENKVSQCDKEQEKNINKAQSRRSRRNQKKKLKKNKLLDDKDGVSPVELERPGDNASSNQSLDELNLSNDESSLTSGTDNKLSNILLPVRESLCSPSSDLERSGNSKTNHHSLDALNLSDSEFSLTEGTDDKLSSIYLLDINRICSPSSDRLSFDTLNLCDESSLELKPDDVLKCSDESICSPSSESIESETKRNETQSDTCVRQENDYFSVCLCEQKGHISSGNEETDERNETQSDICKRQENDYFDVCLCEQKGHISPGNEETDEDTHCVPGRLANQKEVSTFFKRLIKDEVFVMETTYAEHDEISFSMKETLQKTERCKESEKVIDCSHTENAISKSVPPCSEENIPCKENQVQLEVSQHSVFIVPKIEKQTQKPEIITVLTLPCNRLLVCDLSNNLVILLDGNLQCQDKIKLPAKFVYVGILKQQLALCHKNRSRITLLDIFPSLKVLNFFDTRYPVECVAAIDDNRMLVSMLDQWTGNWHLHILSREGKMLRKLKMNRTLLDGYRIAILSSPESRFGYRVLQCCEETDALYCFESDGTEIFKYKVNSPNCLAVHDSGLIFLVDNFQHLRVLSSTGDEIYVTKCCSDVTSIAVSSEMDKVYLTRYRDPKITVLTVSKTEKD